MNKCQLLMSFLLLAGICSSFAWGEEVGVLNKVTIRPLGDVVVRQLSSAPAMVVSLNESRISTEIGAVVNAIPVRVGDGVKKRQSLVTLECEDFRLRLNQTQAAIRSADAKLEFAAALVKRAEQLHSDNNVSEEVVQQSQSDLKIAESERAAAESNMREAELNEERCSVVAPFAGVVLERLVSEGEWVAVGTPLVILLDTQRLELSAQVTLNEVEGLRNASVVEFAAEGERYPLAIRAMPQKIDPKLRQRDVRLIFTDTAALPLPGQSGRLEWQSATPYLPANLLLRRGGRIGLFVVDQGNALFVALPGALEGRPAPVPALSPETMVVIEGRQSLRDRDEVEVVL